MRSSLAFSSFLALSSFLKNGFLALPLPNLPLFFCVPDGPAWPINLFSGSGLGLSLDGPALDGPALDGPASIERKNEILV